MTKGADVQIRNVEDARFPIEATPHPGERVSTHSREWFYERSVAHDGHVPHISSEGGLHLLNLGRMLRDLADATRDFALPRPLSLTGHVREHERYQRERHLQTES